MLALLAPGLRDELHSRRTAVRTHHKNKRKDVNMKRLILVFFMIFGIAGFSPTTSFGQTRVALHATQEEIDIWNQRRINGPYTDDWNRIKANADAFVASPSGTWIGNQLNSPWLGLNVRKGLQPPNHYPGGPSDGSGGDGNRAHGAKARDAAFVYMLTGDTKYRDPVRSLLLNQAATAGTNFCNTTKWPTDYLKLSGNGWTYSDFNISIWQRELVYAYSYIRNSLSSADKATLDAWFNCASKWWYTILHAEVVGVFPNRLNQSWTQSPTCTNYRLTHLGGYMTTKLGYRWDNKRMSYAAFVGAVGAVTGDPTSLFRAKLQVKEWLMFNTYADGTVWDQQRWNDDGNPQTGWGYAATVVGSVITIVDQVARAGDTELYTFSTSSGTCGSEGGPKALLNVLQHLNDLQNHNVHAYASTTSTSNAWQLIDADGESPNPNIRHYVSDLAVCQANVFYKDSKVQQLCQRSTPSSPNSGGYNAWGGDWGNLPGARFMFGQMENKVSPYSTGAAATSTTPTPPSALSASTQ